MEQKINEENIENNRVFCIVVEKHSLSNLYKDLFFRNQSHTPKNKIVYFLFQFLGQGIKGFPCL